MKDVGGSKSRRTGKQEDKIHLVLGEDMAVDGSIRGKLFGGFYGICGSSWSPEFELCVRHWLRLVAHLVGEA